MRNLILLVTATFTIVACTKQNTKNYEHLTPEIRQQRINLALSKVNPNRLAIAEKILLSDKSSEYYLKEVVTTIKETGVKSLGYFVIPKSDDQMVRITLPDWGTFTGWVLYNDGCWYHGTFYWSGTVDNNVFMADSNPYIDNYIGNEPRCMSDDEFDIYC